MNLYSNKQRWKILLFLVAVIIILASLWYSNFISGKIQEREKEKVKLWSKAVQKRTALINLTGNLFEDLKKEERIKADLWVKAFIEISNSDATTDLSFVSEVFFSNTTIPVLLVNEKGEILGDNNLPKDCTTPECKTKAKESMARKNRPIEVSISDDVKQYLYYNDSKIFTELKSTLDDLVNTFITETVVNSASVPVILTDSTQTVALRFGGLDSLTVESPELLQRRIKSMSTENPPISIDVIGQGKQFLFYEDSYILKLLRYFPIVQLSLIGLFLFVAYMIFSTFRKAEQNQVWVGMAKETAHQLGTPLSSLMAWMMLLEEENVDKTVLSEMSKDITRLSTVTDRFSKIGSTPELIEVDLNDVVGATYLYLKTRLSKKVEFTYTPLTVKAPVKISKPLFSWVLENLFKNAVDAMDGVGKLSIDLCEEPNGWVIDISDSGKGIPKSSFKTVFSPGFTTKKRGWGLGLSLTKRIVEEYHKGKIMVYKSELNEGTTFRIIMPIA
ncbi:MAG: PAS domain-containing sensor histidine kinase [Flavobacteriales bacterium]